MAWTRDNLDRPTLARGEFRAVSLGGRDLSGTAPLLDQRAPRAIVHLRSGRAAGCRSLFAAEARAGLSAVPDDESWTAVNVLGDVDPAERLRDEGGVLWFPDVLGREHRFYETPDGALEHEIILPRKPEGLVVPLAVACGPGVTWYWQGPLTQREIDEGAVRPDNVVDSWAIYGVLSGNWLRPDRSRIVEHGTGNIGHLYRPSIEDRNGRQWCTWVVTDGRPVGIRIPVGVSYPAVLGPTFGHPEGASSATANGTLFRYTLTPVSPAANGTLDSLDFYCTADGQSFRLGLYESDGDLVDYTAQAVSVASQWNQVAAANGAAVSSGTSYQMAHWYASALGYKYNAVSNDEQRESHAYHATNPFPDPYPSAGSTGSVRVSIRGTYTESGGGPTPWLYAHRRSARIVA